MAPGVGVLVEAAVGDWVDVGLRVAVEVLEGVVVTVREPVAVGVGAALAPRHCRMLPPQRHHRRTHPMGLHSARTLWLQPRFSGTVPLPREMSLSVASRSVSRHRTGPAPCCCPRCLTTGCPVRLGHLRSLSRDCRLRPPPAAAADQTPRTTRRCSAAASPPPPSSQRSRYPR